jgi:peptide/nickel transport system permease protein
LGLALVVIFIGVALSADVLAPNPDIYFPTNIAWPDDPLYINPHPPGDGTWLGTVPIRVMHKQLDVYTVLVRGTRSALLFGLITGLSTAIIGILVGTISGWMGGWQNSILMRFADAMLTFPVIIAVVFIQQLFMALIGGSSTLPMPEWTYNTSLADTLKSVDPVLVAIIFFSWMPYARITNTMILRVKQTEYVSASRALGADSYRIMKEHLIPNSISPAIVLLARDIGGFVILQATFTFIGLSGRSEWGELLAYARDWIIGPGGNLLTRWWVFIPVTLALILFGIGWNLLGDGLNDWLNPRTRSMKIPNL